jgi:hypothetical protein
VIRRELLETVARTLEQLLRLVGLAQLQAHEAETAQGGEQVDVIGR